LVLRYVGRSSVIWEGRFPICPASAARRFGSVFRAI